MAIIEGAMVNCSGIPVEAMVGGAILTRHK